MNVWNKPIKRSNEGEKQKKKSTRIRRQLWNWDERSEFDKFLLDFFFSFNFFFFFLWFFPLVFFLQLFTSWNQNKYRTQCSLRPRQIPVHGLIIETVIRVVSKIMRPISCTRNQVKWCININNFKYYQGAQSREQQLNHIVILG